MGRNKAERQHIKCLNPRRALCGSSLLFPSLPSCQMISSSLSLSVWNSAGAVLSCLFFMKRRPPARGRGRAHRWRCTSSNTSITVALFLLYCCFIFFFFLWQSILIMSPPPTCAIVAMEISRSVPNCCLREGVCELAVVHMHVVTQRCMFLFASVLTVHL